MTSCTSCGYALSPDSFRPGHKQCNSCRAAYCREWRRTQRGREFVKKNNRKRTVGRYGLSLEDYAVLVLLQDSCCAICGVKADSLVVDHDHATGKVRGLLCNHCNKVLGFARDNPSVFVNATVYLLGESAVVQALEEAREEAGV